MALAAEVNLEKNIQSTISLSSTPVSQHGARRLSWRQDPIATTAWFSAFVFFNGAVIRVLDSQGSFGDFSGSANYILGLGELLVTAFSVVALSVFFSQNIISRLKQVVIPVELNFLGAILALGGVSLFVGSQDLVMLAARPMQMWFSLFIFVFSMTLLARRKGEEGLLSRSKARLSEIAPIARIVRPASQFRQASGGGQGELFPPEETVDVPSTSLRAGDTVRLKSGEVAPCDGVVAEGTAIVEERRYSGVCNLRAKERGDEVFAGSRLTKGDLDIKVGLTQVESLGSTFEHELLDVDSASKETPILTYRMSLLNLATFFVALMAGIVASYEGHDMSQVASVMAGIFSLSLLLSLMGIGPVISKAILGRAFSKGILIRGQRVLSRLVGRRDPVFTVDPLDIFNEPHALSFHLTDSRVDRRELGSVILGLALRAEHPIFREVVALLNSRERVDLKQVKVDDLREYHGRGLTGVVSGADFTIGFEDFLMDRGVYLQSSDAVPTAGEQVMYVAVGDEVVARILFEEAAHRFKNSGIEPLKNRGIRSVLLGGVSQDRLDTLGQKLGFELSSIFGALDPKGKMAKLSSLGQTIWYGAESREDNDVVVDTVTVGVFDDMQATAPSTDIVVFRKSSALFPIFNLLSEKLSWATQEWKIVAGLSIAFIAASIIFGFFGPLVPAGLSLILVGYALIWPRRVASVFDQI